MPLAPLLLGIKLVFKTFYCMVSRHLLRTSVPITALRWLVAIRFPKLALAQAALVVLIAVSNNAFQLAVLMVFVSVASASAAVGTVGLLARCLFALTNVGVMAIA